MIGLDLEVPITKTCFEVVGRWTASLAGRTESDSIAIGPEVTGYSMNRHTYDESQVVVVLTLNEGELVYLKDLKKKCRNRQLFHDVIHVLDSIAYKGLEIWTPEVIKGMYSYDAWHGCDTDSAFFEEHLCYISEMGDEEESGAQAEIEALRNGTDGRLIPSIWDRTLAKQGFIAKQKKPMLTLKALAGLRTRGTATEKALSKAILDLRKLVKRGHVASSDEERWANVEAAFIFLWTKEDEMLGHALDEVINDRWNSGEARESQLVVRVSESSSLEAVMKDVTAVEQLIEIQDAVGAMVDAITGIVGSAK